jgi:hypothetical protein
MRLKTTPPISNIIVAAIVVFRPRRLASPEGCIPGVRPTNCSAATRPPLRVNTHGAGRNFRWARAEHVVVTQTATELPWLAPSARADQLAAGVHTPPLRVKTTSAGLPAVHGPPTEPRCIYEIATEVLVHAL